MKGPSYVAVALAAVVVLAGCSSGDENLGASSPGAEAEEAGSSPRDFRHIVPEGTEAEFSPELQSLLEAGNEAYRRGDHEEAEERFAEAVEREPDLAAGWYGLGMVRTALGDREGADSARVRVHRLAPWIPLEHPSTGAPANPHPLPGGEGGPGGDG